MWLPWSFWVSQTHVDVVACLIVRKLSTICFLSLKEFKSMGSTLTCAICFWLKVANEARPLEFNHDCIMIQLRCVEEQLNSNQMFWFIVACGWLAWILGRSGNTSRRMSWIAFGTFCKTSVEHYRISFVLLWKWAALHPDFTEIWLAYFCSFHQSVFELAKLSPTCLVSLYRTFHDSLFW